MPPKDWHEWTQTVVEQFIELSKSQEATNDRIHDAQAQMMQRFELLEAKLTAKIDKTNELLSGGEDPQRGLIVRTDRLEQNEKQRVWLHRVTIAACISAIVASVSRWVHG